MIYLKKFNEEIRCDYCNEDYSGQEEGFYEALERYHDEEHVDSSNHVALGNFVSWLQKNYENSVVRK